MRRMLDPSTIAVIGASETEGSVGRTIMENAMASAGRTVYPINPQHADDPRPTHAREHRRHRRGDRPRHGRDPRGHRARRARAVRGRRSTRGHRRVGRLLGDRRGRCRTRRSDPRHPTRQPDARGWAELPWHHPAHGRAQRLVPEHQSRAGQHRAHLAKRRAGYGHARLGDRCPHRLFDVRIGGRHGRCGLRRSGRLPRRGRTDAQHPHLHGEHRERPTLHERRSRLRAQQAHHRAQAGPLRRECARRALAHRLDGRRRRDLRGRIPPRRRRARARGRRPLPRGSGTGLAQAAPGA